MQDFLNFYQSTENIATSGQPSADQFSRMAAQGYKTVINLAMPDSDNAIPNEGSIVSSLGMNYLHLPVPFEAPNSHHVAQFFKFMQALEGEKTWIHCAVNARVSAFMYLYLTLIKNQSIDQASSPLLLKWRPSMDKVWSDLLALELTQIHSNKPTTVPVLRIFDEDKAKQFYVDFLGFKLDWEHRFSADLPLYMQVSKQDCCLHLSEHHGDACPGALVRITTLELSNYHQQLLAKNYGYARPDLVDAPWGGKDMSIADPFGNKICFSEF